MNHHQEVHEGVYLVGSPDLTALRIVAFIFLIWATW